MISDYEILGITQTDDISLIKKAYHKRVKDLHPDTSCDEAAVKNHFLFVQVCRAYKRLAEKHKTESSAHTLQKNTEDKSTSQMPASETKTVSLAAHKDPAYVLYKNGIQLYSAIHPSQWKTAEKSVIATEIGDDEESQRKSKALVMDLVRLFPKAYYYFSLVVSDYPDSPWYADSVEKMNLIEKRMSTYKKIIESFSSWEKYKAMEKENEKLLKKNRENWGGKTCSVKTIDGSMLTFFELG